jgi:hypothetical protein
LDCEETYDAGTEVTLMASADPPTVFVQWGGEACVGSVLPTCTFVMDASKTVTAEFDDPTIG